MTVLTKIDTPLGMITAASDKALTGLCLKGKIRVCLAEKSKMG